MQIFNDSNKSIKVPGGKCVSFAEIVGSQCLFGHRNTKISVNKVELSLLILLILIKTSE